MKRVGLLVGIGAVIVLAVAAYVFFSGGSGEPSTEVTAPPIAATTTAPQPTDATTTSTSGTTTQGDTTTAPETTEAAPADPGATGDVVTFELDQAGSTVSFVLNEELNGSPAEVIGSTSELAGQIQVDFANPENSLLGQIVINARTLSTGNTFRDRAIRGQILDSAQDEFEFITFTPTTIEGLPADAATPFAFTVTGDLTIRTITAPATFTVEITSASETSVEGSATAEVLRSDFDLNIPSVPQVANVTDEVQLNIEFTATPTE